MPAHDCARSVALCCSLTAATLSACSAGASPRPTGIPSSAGRIVVLGDSLAVSPSRTASFPAELQRRLDAAGGGWTVVNAGVSGDRTADGVTRVASLLTADTRILILELGANDGLRGVSVSQVERNLSTIIEGAQQRGIQVLLCGMLVPPRYGWEYAIEFPRVFQRLAEKYEVPLVPFILEGVALNPDLNGPDGIHPNAAGARRIADTVWKHLEPLIERILVAQR